MSAVTPYPRPAALPSRPPFLVGIDVPTTIGDFPTSVYFGPEMLSAFRAHHFQAIRVDCHYRRNDEGLLTTIAEAGFRPFPIANVWGLHDPRPADLRGAIVQAAIYFEALAARLPWISEWEVENEPGGRMTPSEGAEIVDVVGRAIKRGNPDAFLWGPGTYQEMIHADTGELDRWGRPKLPWSKPWYVQFRAELAKRGGSIDGQAIHPYRHQLSRQPPEESGFGDRAREHAEVVKQAGPIPIGCTEVGWDIGLNPVDLDLAGTYIARELEIQRDQGLTCCFFFGHHGPFGIFNDDYSPRPAALAVQAFLAPLPPLEYPSDPIDVPHPFDPPLGGPMQMMEFGNIPGDVHTRILARLATTLNDNGCPAAARAGFNDESVLAAYVDQTYKVGMVLHKGILPGDYAQWEDQVFWHTDRELRRIFHLQTDPLSPAPLDFP